MMMNDPMVLEASRVLAASLLLDKSETEDKIFKAFRLIVCRKPLDSELQLLTTAYETELQNMTPRQAADLVATGEYPLSTEVEQVKLAALMLVVNTIYNMEETITKS